VQARPASSIVKAGQRPKRGTQNSVWAVLQLDHLGNVPTDVSFSAVGSFPSHQLGNNPSELFGPSIGLLYRRIGQKSDLEETIPRVGAARCTPDPPAPTRAPPDAT
jgi:hypothetical protein